MFSRAYHPPILMYHSVAFLFEAPFPNAVRIRPSIFAKQMEYLKDHRYNVVDLDLLFQWIIEGKELPPKTIALTLDDGYLDNYVNAYPILKFYGFPATVFLITRCIGRDPQFITWDQAREMEKSGIRFGNHTATHPHLDLISLEDARKDIIEAKETLSKELQAPSQVFCYPFGGYTIQIQKLVQECGYEGAMATSVDGALPLADRYAFRRLKISDSAQNKFIFAFEISGYYSAVQKIQKRVKIIRKKLIETCKGDTP